MARFGRLALLAFIAVAAGGVGLPSAQARTAFFSHLDDVPVPPGFTERADLATAFEGAPGRILVATAEGVGPAEGARAWAVSALKGLGWSLAEADDRQAVLIRGRETLTLEAMPAPGGRSILRVRVVVRPAPADPE